MAHIETRELHDDMSDIRRTARRSGHVQRAQGMLLAAGLAAFAIVAVAAAMVTTLL